MQSRARQLALDLLPALLLTAGCLLSLPYWPEPRTLLAEPSLWNPLLLELVRAALLCVMLLGILATAGLRRFLAWPWLYLCALLLVQWRQPVDALDRLLGSSAELAVLLALCVGEHLLLSLLPGRPGRQRRLISAGLAAVLTLSGLLAAPLPGNPHWLATILPLAALMLCGPQLLHIPLSQAKKLAARLQLPRVRLSAAISLPRLRMPANIRHRKRVTETEAVRSRPMLSLEHGYLVRHDGAGDERRRRTG
ncbi:hypothetical protein KDL44_06680 [bacterium]|nr:hypothetical protein [bacterium]